MGIEQTISDHSCFKRFNPNKMKRTIIFTLVLLVLCSCSQNVEHKCIAPLPAGISADSLTDCMVSAHFSVSDFNFEEGSLSMTIYSEDLYDAVDISLLEIGDTVVYDSSSIVVATVTQVGDVLCINEGIEEGGACLQAYEGGTYRAIQFDDHSVYTELGQAEVPFAANFVIIDCGENPTDKNDTIIDNQQQYLRSQQEYRRDFISLNTRVLVEQGVITQIQRRWIP